MQARRFACCVFEQGI